MWAYTYVYIYVHKELDRKKLKGKNSGGDAKEFPTVGSGTS